MPWTSRRCRPGHGRRTRGRWCTVRTQPVFSLLKIELLESLVKFTQSGGRKIDAWTAQHRCADGAL